MALLKRLLLVVMLWPLAFTTAFGQDAPGRFELTGVLISPKGRAALINGEFAREGDRVGGAEILSIGEKSVSLALGSAEYTILVGSSTIAHRRPAMPHRSAYTVKRGDTLSGIAERFAGNGISLNQVMIALFEANPQAFDGNINRIREGAQLRIPRGDDLQSRSFAAATAEVRRQAESWRPSVKRSTAIPPQRQDYGPIARGDTLSRIAASLKPDSVTLNQMMMSLYDANPHAFDGNINKLRRGMILRIPEAAEVSLWTRTIANAEVLRHTELWRSRYARGAEPSAIDTLLTAASPSGTVLPHR